MMITSSNLVLALVLHVEAARVLLLAVALPVMTAEVDLPLALEVEIVKEEEGKKKIGT